MYKERPRIQILPTTTDKWLDVISYLLLILLIAYPVYSYASLPNTIPVHMNIAGEVDRYGSKAIILLLPAVGVFQFILLTILLRYPHIYNYPGKVTEQNALIVYTAGLRFMRIIRLWALIILILVTVSFIRVALNRQENSERWLVPVVFLSSVVLIIYVLIKFMRIKKIS